MIIDTDFKILIFKDLQCLGELKSIDLETNTLKTKDNVEYNINEVRVFHDVSGESEA
jgi:hypothetical protein